MSSAPFDYRGMAEKVLADPALRTNIWNGPDDLAQRRAAAFADPVEAERARDQAAEIRMRALSKLPELLERLEAKCLDNGMQVHWAETVEEANGIVLDILQQSGASAIVKGKSMATEEMHLNAFLEAHDIESLETDLGEYIVQLAGQTPSHIIAPAFHMNKRQIAELMHEKLRYGAFTDNPEDLTGIAQRALREKFRDADAGITGVNFAVADTGTLCLVENEGNGRMCSTVPPVHIAVMGIDKVVERLEDVPPLLDMLVRSCTGQRMTTYFNMITSPRKPGEKDGPEKVHLLILDNVRSRMYVDEELRNTLRCIRCGACLNVCPVYKRIGGHSYRYSYSGPIGAVFNVQVHGLREAGVLAGYSTLCGACDDVCPVRIPLTKLLLRLRSEGSERPVPSPATRDAGGQRKPLEAAVWTVWQRMNRSPALLRLANRLFVRLACIVPWRVLPILREWAAVRVPPVPGRKTLHDLARQKGIDRE